MRLPMVVAIMAIALAPRAGLATVGGPTFLDVWGWDPRNEGVVVQILSHDGSDAFDRVILMRPGEPDSVVDMPGCIRREDPHQPGSRCAATVRGFRNGLDPLPSDSIPAIRLPFSHRVVRSDTVSTVVGQHPRFIVEARFDPAVLYRVTTFHRTEVVMVARYPLPECDTDLAILAFFGDGFEVGYETWVGVFVPRRGESPPDRSAPPEVVEVEWTPRR